eukprot:gene11080-7709_t
MYIYIYIQIYLYINIYFRTPSAPVPSKSRAEALLSLAKLGLDRLGSGWRGVDGQIDKKNNPAIHK